MLSFQKYWWTNNSAIWLDEKHLACNLTSSIFQIWRLNRKIENWKNFHFALFPAKNNNKTSWKLRKSFVWAYYEHFLLILGQTRNFLENLKLPLFLFLDFYCCAKFEKKLICQVRGKPVTEERTDGQAWIYKTSTPPVVQNRSTPQLPYIWITEWKNGLLFVIFLFRAITCLYFALSVKNYHDNTNKIWKDTVDERVDTVVRKDHIIPLLTLFPPWGKGQILTTLPPFIHTHTHTHTHLATHTS